MAKKRTKKASTRKKASKKAPAAPVATTIVPASAVDVVPSRPGDHIVIALEDAGAICRLKLAQMKGDQNAEGDLSAQEWGRFNALVQSLTRIERSLRQWRELQRREMGELSEKEIRDLLPKALRALLGDVDEDLVREVLGALSRVEAA